MRVHGAVVGFGVRHLQDVLGKDDAYNVMDGAFVNRHPGKGLVRNSSMNFSTVVLVKRSQAAASWLRGQSSR